MKLHIYGQTYPHDHAFLVGNKEALKALREAIDAALNNQAGGTTVFATDGEGYDVKVYCEEEEEYWGKSKLPYNDRDMFIEYDEDVGPWDLFKKHER